MSSPHTPAPLEEDSALETISTDSVSAVFSTIERSGPWEVTDRIRARALCGEVKLDFTTADLPPSGVVEIECDVLFGQLELRVPEGSQVDSDDLQVSFGELKHQGARRRARPLLRRLLTGDEAEDELASDDDPDGSDEPPLFVLSGRVLFGGCRVRAL